MLKDHCDKKGLTINGNLRPELHCRYKGKLDRVSGLTKLTTGGAISTNISTAATTTMQSTNANISGGMFREVVAPALPHQSTAFPATTQSAIPNASTAEMDDSRPFTAAEDKQLLSSIQFATKHNMPLEPSWATIARFLKRSAATLKARWTILKETQSQAQQPLQPQGIRSDVIGMAR